MTSIPNVLSSCLHVSDNLSSSNLVVQYEPIPGMAICPDRDDTITSCLRRDFLCRKAIFGQRSGSKDTDLKDLPEFILFDTL